MKTGIILCYGLFEETNQEYKNYLEWISKDIAEQKIEQVVICGGSTNNLKPHISEASTAFEYLKKLNPSFTNYLLEDKSLTTNQNLENATKLIDSNGEIIVWCDLIRLSKIIWMSLFFFLKLDREQIADIIFDFVKDRKIKPFVYQNLTIKGFDFPSRDKYLATAQSFSVLLEVEALYNNRLDQKILDQRKKDFGISS